jgi:glutaredoxin
MKAILYTNNCPKCKILKKNLEQKNIEFEVCEDMASIVAKGFRTVPVLEINGTVMDFNSAILWVQKEN